MTSKGLDDFAEFEATLQKIDDILNESDEKQQAAATAAEAKTDFDKLDPDNVRLKVRENRTVINRKSMEEDKQKEAGMAQAMNQQSFMQQVEKDANERAEARAKREYEAEVQKSHGNEAFRNGKYEKAILHYGKALAQIKDSAITYNNRALCYIKLCNYKRALQDCQHVVDKLQETNLRAWLYKATAYKRLGQTTDFVESVAKAREHNPKQLAYIEKYIKQMEAETEAET